MGESDDQPTAAKEPKRGEAAWKAAKEAVAERNERARRTARKGREAEERRMIQRRRRLR